MEKIAVGKGSISLWTLITAVGGFLAFIAFFLSMVKISSGGVDWFNITGIDMFSESLDGEKAEDVYKFWRVMPFIAALTGIATVIVCALPLFGIDKPALKLVAMILGIATLALGIIVIAASTGSAGFENVTDDVEFHRQIGAYFILYGGILATAAGFCDWKGVLLSKE